MAGKSVIFSMFVATLIGGFSYHCMAQSKSQSQSQSLSSYPTKQKVVHHVKNQTGGRVLDIKQRSSNNGKVWRVKFLKDGKIQYMDVAPQATSD